MERLAIFNREIPVCLWSVCVTVLACLALLACMFCQMPSAQAQPKPSAEKPSAVSTPVQTVQQPALPSPINEHPLAVTAQETAEVTEAPVALTPTVPTAPRLKPAAIAVFPLVQHADRSKAFSDLPVVFSTSVARQLSHQFALSGTPFKVLNPIYSYDTLASKNYAGTYKRMVADTLEAGDPRESDIMDLVTLLSTPEHPVEWVMLTQSSLDFAHPGKPTLKQWPMAFIYDERPADPNWFISGQVRLYHVSPGLPLVWQGKTTGHVTWSQLGPVSSTIMGNSESLQSFQSATGTMAKTLVKQFPKSVYLPQTSVQAKLAPTEEANPLVIYPEEQSLLKRILQR